MTQVEIDGRFESAAHGMVAGWAWDATRPAARLTVEVVVDGRIVAAGVADVPDRSLLRAGIGDGAHVFQLALPDELADGAVHEIAVIVPEADRQHVRAVTRFIGSTADRAGRWGETRFIPDTSSATIPRRHEADGRYAMRSRRNGAPIVRLASRLAAVADRRRLPRAAFIGLLALGALLVYIEMRGLSFFQDDWDFLVGRRGLSADTLLRPAGPHLSLVPILVFKAMLQIFGMRSFNPWKVLTAADLVLTAATVGFVCRRRWGVSWSLVPVALMVTLGPGAATLLWPFQVGYAIATSTAIVALVAVAHDSRRGDRIACVALCVSLASASQGVAALAGAALIIGLGRDRRRRLWVIVIPAILYGLWYLHWGRSASDTHLALWTQLLPYTFRALSTTAAALVGLARPDPTGNAAPLDHSLGVPLAFALILAFVVALHRGWRPSRLFWGVAATLVLLWVASCLSNIGGNRSPETERYVPTDAALLLICLCEAIPRPRLSRAGVTVACAAVAVVCATNAALFADARHGLAASARATRATLGALLIARDVVKPDLRLPGGPAGLEDVEAGQFLSGARSFGTDAYSVAQLHAAGDADRHLADEMLIEAENIALQGATPTSAQLGANAPALAHGSGRTSGPCVTTPGLLAALTVPQAGVLVTTHSGAAVNVGLSRFGSGPTELSSLPGGHAATLRFPSDRAPEVPWLVWVSGGRARVCSIRG